MIVAKHILILILLYLKILLGDLILLHGVLILHAAGCVLQVLIDHLLEFVPQLNIAEILEVAFDHLLQFGQILMG